MRTKHRLIDGATVDLEADARVNPPTSWGYALFQSGPQELGTGPQTLAEAAAMRDGVVFEEEYAFQGGVLRLGFEMLLNEASSISSLIRTAAWRGEANSLTTFLEGSSYQDLIARLDHFTFNEFENGLVLIPKKGVTFDQQGRTPFLVARSEDLGLIRVDPMTATTRNRLPEWQGRSVRGGELFQQPSAEGLTYLILVAETCVVTIQPDLKMSEDDVLHRASGIVASWS